MSTIRKIDPLYRVARQKRREDAAAKIKALQKAASDLLVKSGVVKFHAPHLPETGIMVTSRQDLLARKEWSADTARYRGIRVGSGKEHELQIYARDKSRSKYTPHFGAKQRAKVGLPND